MSTRPIIFISAVSKELHSARDHVAKTLLSLGYEPKWQDIAPTETGMLPKVLRDWIDDSDAVIQLVGHHYGFAPKEPDPEFGQCSYTQLEALYARQQSKKVWYFILSPEHPTDPCDAEAPALRDLQDAYRTKVTSTSHLYHRSSSLDKTELLVHRIKNELAELRATSEAREKLLHAKADQMIDEQQQAKTAVAQLSVEGKKQQRSFGQRFALAFFLLLVLVFGVVVLLREQKRTGESVGDAQRKLEQQTELTTQTQSTVTEIKEQGDKILAALRAFPQVQNQQPATVAKEDDAARIASAYTVLETKLDLPAGSLAKELPKFAQQLLQRSGIPPLDRASALFATLKFAEAETEALKAKDQALASGQPLKDVIAALRLAGISAQAQVHYPQAMEHFTAASALTSQEGDVLQWLDLKNDISWLYYRQGSYREFLAQAQQIWQAAQKTGKEEDPVVLKAHMIYAISLDVNGNAPAAEVEHRALIKLNERVLGAEDPTTIASRGNLANSLISQKKYTEAEAEMRGVVELSTRVLGAEHPLTLMSRENLANALQACGKGAEAEQEMRSVLNLLERDPGAEHPITLTARMNLAYCQGTQGKPAEAEQALRVVAQLQERVLGAEHPDTLMTRSNIINMLQAQGKSAEAQQECQAVVKIRERVLGPEHPSTLGTRKTLAEILQSQSKNAEAESEQRAVWQILKRVLGAEHPETLQARSVLASMLQLQGRNAEAEQECREVVKIQERVLGPGHLDTLMTRMNLASSLGFQGKHAEAEQECREVVKIQERVLGPEHPLTLMSRTNLANSLIPQGKAAEAEKEHRALLKIKQRVLGADNPDTLRSRVSLTNALQAQRKFAEAESELRAVLQTQKRLLGAQHPDILMSQISLANVLQSQNKYAEAEPEQRTLLQLQEHIFGAEHPAVAQSCYNLAISLAVQNKLELARPFMQRAEQLCMKLLGPDNPQTLQARSMRERMDAGLKQRFLK